MRVGLCLFSTGTSGETLTLVLYCLWRIIDSSAARSYTYLREGYKERLFALIKPALSF
jgi:hypothetical protein